MIKRRLLVIVALFIIITISGCAKETYKIEVDYDSSAGEVIGTGEYIEGEEVKLQASANEKFQFVRFVENEKELTKEPIYSFTANKDRNIRAIFEKDNAILEIASEDKTMGTVSEGGVFKLGEEVTVTANPKEGYKLSGWYDDGDLISAERRFTFEIENDVNLEARFSLAKEVTITLTTNEPNAVTEMLILDANNNAKEVVRESETIKIWVNNVPKDDIERQNRDFLNYQYKGLYINGEQVTTDFTYEFIAEEDVEIQAIFEPFSFSDINIRESIKQNIKENIDKPDVYDVALASPSGKYILAIAESTAYILCQDGEKVLYAFELAIIFDPKNKHDYEIHWLDDESGFYYFKQHNRNREANYYINIQYIDSTQKIIEIPSFRGSSQVGQETNPLNSTNILSSSNWIGFVLEYSYQDYLAKDIMGISIVNLDSHETHYKSFDHTYYIGEWSKTFPGDFIFSEDSKKLLYSYYCGTGYIDLETFEDNKLSNSIIQDSVHVSPLRFEDEKVFFYAGPHVWYDYFQHLFVLDIQTNELSIVNYNFTDSYSTYEIFARDSIGGVSEIGVVYANSPVNKVDSETEIGSYVINEEPVSYGSSNIEDSINTLRKYYESKENGEFYLSVFDKFSNMIKNSYSSVYEPEALYNIKIETDKRFLKDVLVDSNGNHFVVLEYRSGQDDSIILLIDNQGSYKKIYESSNALELLSVTNKDIMIAENIGQGYEIKVVKR